MNQVPDQTTVPPRQPVTERRPVTATAGGSMILSFSNVALEWFNMVHVTCVLYNVYSGNEGRYRCKL